MSNRKKINAMSNRKLLIRELKRLMDENDRVKKLCLHIATQLYYRAPANDIFHNGTFDEMTQNSIKRAVKKMRIERGEIDKKINSLCG